MHKGRMKRILLGIAWRVKKKTSWVKKHIKAEDIMSTIKRRKWTWAEHVMRRTYNRCTVRVTEQQPKDGTIRQGRQRTRWKDEIGSCVGVTWNRQAADREKVVKAGVNSEAAASDDYDMCMYVCMYSCPFMSQYTQLSTYLSVYSCVYPSI